MRSSLKIFIVCACSAIAGSLISIRIRECWGWIGFLSGGLVGYLLGDGRRICSETKEFYSAIKGELNFLCISFLSIVYVTTDIALPAYVIFKDYPVQLITTCFAFSLIFIPIVIKEECPDDDKQLWVRNLARVTNPIRVYFNIIPLKVWEFVQISMKGLTTAMKSLELCFLFVHSDLQLSCCIYATAGIGISYTHRGTVLNSLYGGVIGMLAGIVISKYVRKLVAVE